MHDLLNGLNAPQREAVMYGEGPLLVLAGPGSGKTTVMIRRIRYLLSQKQIPPEKILAITFTKDAALSMQQRFQEQEKGVLPVSFGTFHSVFYQILLQSGYLQNPKLLTMQQKKEILMPILKGIRKTSYYDYNLMSEDAAKILAAISFYKNTKDNEGALMKLPIEWRTYFAQIFEIYQQRVRSRNAVDFDDMLYECLRMLERDEDRRAYWQERFSHILIDEFQDINPMQYQVLRYLAKEPYNLFAVGDDDQAIYGFRGSDPACLRQFVKDFGAGQVLLDQNYRSTPQIVEAACSVIGENRERFAKKLYSAGSGEGEKVKVKSFEEREEQTAYLKQELADFCALPSQKSGAVLFRTNIYMQSFAARLDREGIGYIMKEKNKNIYEHFVVRDVMAYLQLAAGDRRRALFLQIMNKPSRYLSREALGEMKEVDFESLKEWYRRKDNGHRLENLAAITLLQKQLHAMEKMSPALAVKYVCRAIGYRKYLETMAGADRERLATWLELLEWLEEDAKEYGCSAEWMEMQRNGGNMGRKRDKGMEITQGAEREKNAPCIWLMTVHSAKGLEFDKVWIPDCNEKIFPHGIMPDEKTVEEERRIFYVGMTRAKKGLELLYLTGTKERPKLMSRFLNPLLLEGHSSRSSSNSQLSRYSSKASATFSYSSSSSM